MTERLGIDRAVPTATCPFDHHSPELKGAAKYEFFADLRTRRVQRTDAWGGFWIVSHAADVETVLLDATTFSSQRDGVLVPRQVYDVPFPGLEYDPPAHTGHRRLYAKAVSRGALRAAEPYVRELATRLVADFAAAGGGEFVAAVSTPLPTQSVSVVVGLPQVKARRIREATEHAWKHVDEPDAMGPLVAMLVEELDARRAEPRDDYLTWLLNAELDGRPLTEVEILGFLNGLILAGHETTVNASSTLAYLLARDPALRARVVDDPKLVSNVVEESLRYDSPVQAFARTATRDVEIGGVTIAEGDKLMVLFGAANHDPAAFPDPGSFDPERPRLKHYSFGWGIHRCVGAPLAQLELRILCEVLAAYDFSVVGEPVYSGPSGGGSFSGMTALHLAVS